MRKSKKKIIKKKREKWFRKSKSRSSRTKGKPKTEIWTEIGSRNYLAPKANGEPTPHR
jgi:hypothetical protein